MEFSNSIDSFVKVNKNHFFDGKAFSMCCHNKALCSSFCAVVGHAWTSIAMMIEGLFFNNKAIVSTQWSHFVIFLLLHVIS